MTVLDVYDIAASIGKEFEEIIDRHGPDVVSALMPKVITVLEQLEDSAVRFDSEGQELLTLKMAVNRMEVEKLERIKEKCRSEKDIEELELAWQLETRELNQLVEKLQQENKQLREAIAEKSGQRDAVTQITEPVSGLREEIQIMLRLKDIIDQQKVQLRSLRRQLNQLVVDLDAMQQQSIRLAKLNAVLRRQRCVCKRKADQLSAEKRELELLLQAKDELIEKARCQLPPPHSADLSSKPLPAFSMSNSMVEEMIKPSTPSTELTESKLIEHLNDEGKMVTEASEKCVTIQEFRDLLTERNKLTSRVIEVKEELSVYERAGDNDPPVQGPIDREPYEKLYGHSPKGSGIKQFFENLFLRLSS